MKRLFLLLVVLILIAGYHGIRGAANAPAPPRGDSWEKVREAMAKGLPKTAIEHLNPIFATVVAKHGGRPTRRTASRYKVFRVITRRTEKEDGSVDIRRWMRVSYSPDGIHWRKVADSDPCADRSTVFYNPFRDAFHWGHVQSAGGCCLIVGDKIYFYFPSNSL